jgi:transcriptional regulator GlxA family with amidase domain
MQHLGIFIFDGVEVLDFAGPFEVFSVASQLSNYQTLKVFTFGAEANLIRTVNGLQVLPDYGLENLPVCDFLVIPGGDGSKQVIQKPEVLASLKNSIDQTEWTMSVCSGSRILGKLGYLDGKPYCTHHLVFESMKQITPTGYPKPELRFVQSSDRIYTAAGISAGIDLAFFLLEKTFGNDLARQTAEYMEYLPYLNQS